MLVNDKARDIAILRAMGAGKGTILRVFFMSGAFIGLLGTLSGVGLGLGFAYNIEEIRQWLEGLTDTNLFAAEVYFLSKLPAVVEIEDTILISSMSIFLSFLATLYPAWKASKTLPAEAMRYE